MEPDRKEIRRQMTCNALMGEYDPNDYVYTVTHTVTGDGTGVALPPCSDEALTNSGRKTVRQNPYISPKGHLHL